MRAVVVVLVVLVSTGLAGGVLVSAGASRADPVPLTGVAFKGASHLHLLVASNPPFVLDVDSGRVTRIPAPVVMRRGVLSVTAVAGVAGGVAAGDANAQIYVVRARGARPVFLGGGSYAVPSSDGHSVWIKSVSGSACALRQVGLGGDQIGQVQSFACNETIQFGGSLGLIAGRTR